MLGDPGSAAATVRAALAVMRRADDPIGVALCLDALAWIAASRDEMARSLTLLAAADGAWAIIPAPLPPGLRTHHEEALGWRGERFRPPSTGQRWRRAARWTGTRPSRSPWGSPPGRGRPPAEAGPG